MCPPDADVLQGDRHRLLVVRRHSRQTACSSRPAVPSSAARRPRVRRTRWCTDGDQAQGPVPVQPRAAQPRRPNRAAGRRSGAPDRERRWSSCAAPYAIRLRSMSPARSCSASSAGRIRSGSASHSRPPVRAASAGRTADAAYRRPVLPVSVSTTRAPALRSAHVHGPLAGSRLPVVWPPQDGCVPTPQDPDAERCRRPRGTGSRCPPRSELFATAPPLCRARTGASGVAMTGTLEINHRARPRSCSEFLDRIRKVLEVSSRGVQAPWPGSRAGAKL